MIGSLRGDLRCGQAGWWRRRLAYARTRCSNASSASKSASSPWPKDRRSDASTLANVSTTCGSNWVPAQARSSATAASAEHRLPVGVARREHVVGVGDRDQPRRQRDLLAREPVRVAGAVPALVVAEHDVGHRPVAVDAAHDPRPVRGVAADDLPLLLAQRLGGEQDRVGERELADVVEQPGGVRELLLRGGRPSAIAIARA